MELKNNTTFPSNWKELVRTGPQIFQLYLQYLYDGQVRYGPRTIVFMQVGMFHEMYGVENEYMNIGLVSQLAHDLNIQMTRRKKSIIENSPKNYLMAGFPSVHLSRYINIMVEEDWTVIVVDQIEQTLTTKSASLPGLSSLPSPPSLSSQPDQTFIGVTDLFNAVLTIEEEEDDEKEEKDDEEDESPAKKVIKNKNKAKKIVSRAITQVASPSTFVGKLMKADNNFLVSLYLREDKYHKKAGQALNIVAINGAMLLSIGCSAIDVTTGENFSYEIYSNVEDQGLAIDEAFRFLCTFQPREIIINSENLSRYDEDALVSKLELHNVSHHIHLNQVRPDFKKISYQNTVLKKCFPNCGALTPLEYLDMETKSLAALSYILMLQYAYEHNEKLITSLPKPKILETYTLNKKAKNLILANNTINQLNLIPEISNCNNNLNSKVFRSVFTVINKTSCAMGARLLRHKFLNPITDPDELQDHYCQIEELRKLSKLQVAEVGQKEVGQREIGQRPIWKELEKHLKIKDIERMNRKINLKTIQPLEWQELEQDLKKISELLEVIKSENILSGVLKENMSLLKDLERARTYYTGILDLDEAAKYTLTNVEDNFFKPKFDGELDTIGFKIKHYEQFFKTMTRSLSNMITPGTDYVILKRADGGFYLTVTKTRFAQLKLKFKDPITFCIDSTNYTIDPSDLMETPVSKKSSNLNVQNAILTKMSLELAVLHEELRTRVIEKYYEFLGEFSNQFGLVLTNISGFVAKIDVLKSIAKVADEYNYCKPEIVKSKESNSFIQAIELRHPIIERINQNIKYVPHSLALGKVPPEVDTKLNIQDGMIIFGLNCSGKSSLMKSVGINLILAQAGFYVAAKEFKYYPYDQLLTRIISEDNLFKGQSTFEVEMTELRGILNRAKNSKCLVLGDELTHGSETTSGLAIIASAVITLASVGTNFIFTSHLHPLSSMSRIKELPNVRSYHLRVMYDETKDILIYDRTLNEGSGQAIYGLEVLKSLHISEDFLKLAHKIRREIMEIPDNIIANRQSKYNCNLFMNECEICKGDAEDTHHINQQCTANEKGFIDHYHKNVLSNLVVLCKKCHLAAHSKSDDNRILKINGYLETSNGPVLDYTWT